MVEVRSNERGKVVVDFKDATLERNRICPPELSGQEMSEFFLVYVKTHPNRLKLPAHITAAETFAAVSSCEK